MRIMREFITRLRKLPKSAVIPVAVFLAAAFFGPVLAPYDPIAQDLSATHQNPSFEHPLGTDKLGRDMLSRVLEAARTSAVGIGFVLAVSLTIGVLLGAIAGFVGGLVDEGIMRVVDVGQSVPSLIVALAVIGVFGTGFWVMVLALALAWWPSYARVSRAVVTSVLRQPYMEALHVVGASPWRVFLVHLLPSAAGAVMVYATADAGAIALTMATLSFLGLGIRPPTPEWGQMVVDALPYLEQHPLEVIFPGLALTLVVIGFNLLGEAVALNNTPKALPRRVRKQILAAQLAEGR
jgi:peptide/nickel transport system permease protein